MFAIINNFACRVQAGRLLIMYPEFISVAAIHKTNFENN